MHFLRAAFLVLCMAAVTGRATVFTVDRFSKDYYGKISISDTSAVFSPGWVAIYDRKTNRELIRVNSDELALTLHEGRAEANIRQLPYGEQSLIIYEDFNFDGILDFAIEDGQNSCYHGPSFQIYIAGKNGFEEDPEFTRLAQEYCGMFRTDPKARTISVMTKSGCCWHQFSVFRVTGGKPVEIQTTETDHTHFPYVTETTEMHEGSKVTKTVTRTLVPETEGIVPVLSFRLEKNNKQVQLFVYENALHYCFSNEQGHVELAYPEDNPEEEQAPFSVTTAGGRKAVAFTNRDARYEIAEADNGSTELVVMVGGKTYRSAGKAAGKSGSLRQLPEKVANVQ